STTYSVAAQREYVSHPHDGDETAARSSSVVDCQEKHDGTGSASSRVVQGVSGARQKQGTRAVAYRDGNGSQASRRRRRCVRRKLDGRFWYVRRPSRTSRVTSCFSLPRSEPIVTREWVTSTLSLVPRDQYDAALFIDRVTSPSYLRF